MKLQTDLEEFRMKNSLFGRPMAPLVLVLALLTSTSIPAAEVKVMVSGGFQAAMKVLAQNLGALAGTRLL